MTKPCRRLSGRTSNKPLNEPGLIECEGVESVLQYEAVLRRISARQVSATRVLRQVGWAVISSPGRNTEVGGRAFRFRIQWRSTPEMNSTAIRSRIPVQWLIIGSANPGTVRTEWTRLPRPQWSASMRTAIKAFSVYSGMPLYRSYGNE